MFVFLELNPNLELAQTRLTEVITTNHVALVVDAVNSLAH
jgi:hypothetical protein